MYKTIIKRSLDIVFALLSLLLIGWLLVIVAVLLFIANKGSGIFFLQERPGKDERLFKIIKFKSMTDARDSNGDLLPDRDRITSVGTFIRKTSIDELPQLINVLKGDMSVVGPRPLLPEYLPYYSEREKLRHTVRPGITGFSQVKGRNFITWDEMLELDAYYVENMSLKLDIKIILKTFRNVLNQEGVSVIASDSGEGKLCDVRKEMHEINYNH